VVKALFDTNILIDHLNGVAQARAELQRYETKAISIITWLEVMVRGEGELEATFRGFLHRFEVVHIEQAIAERTVALRRAYRLKMPDAIIWATAQARGILFVTRDNDFATDDPGIRVPYIL
jgi:predicted nucleic acid-binding protein